jgi:fructosamine-3-kinase
LVRERRAETTQWVCSRRVPDVWKAELGTGVSARVAAAEPVAGGDINDAYRVTLQNDTGDRRVVFVKTHAYAPAGMFAAEADGLAWLREGTLRVPQVVAVGESFLALEWLELGARGRGFDEALGRGLAQLHRLGAPAFGYPRANFLATIPQAPIAVDDGPTFWIEHRLRPVMRRAHEDGRMPDVQRLLDELRARPDRFGPPEPPARLHGDLWWGNVVACGGEPTLIDPAVYGGHREVDLAMLALFGGVSDALVTAYSEIHPLADGWRDRVALWQLYPLACHAALFGGGYGGQAARSLAALTSSA